MEQAPVVKIASFNIANSSYEEAKFPLWQRLPCLLEYITNSAAKFNFDILCVQELQGTGVGRNDGRSSLSVFGVIDSIRSALMSASIDRDWQVVYSKVNPTKNSFYRATFYDVNRLMVKRNTVFTVIDSEDSPDDHLVMETDFYWATSTSTGAAATVTAQAGFRVLNCHAPMNLKDKTVYWQLMSDRLTENCPQGVRPQIVKACYSLAIGDVNKFSEHLDVYRGIFDARGTPDRIQGELTFVSFDFNLNPEGQQWRSSLDAVISHGDNKIGVEIVPTVFDSHSGNLAVSSPDGDSIKGLQYPMRPTDHFLIVATVNSWAN